MDIIKENLSINLYREHLELIPRYPLPQGYSFRWYQPGDEALWVEIYTKAEAYIKINAELFWKEFGEDKPGLQERMCFVLDDQQRGIGTATAWFNREYFGADSGRIHWVAIIPDAQGKGLSKPLMTTVLRKMRTLGHIRTYLVTSSARIPAINLYLKFGFVPEIRHEDDLNAWKGIQEYLGRNLLDIAYFHERYQ
jgi:GNAT superfamily N-acetyltransferase